MKFKKILPLIIALGLSIILISFDLPKGWFTAGVQVEKYEMGIDRGAGQDGKNAATIKSIEKKIKGYGMLMQYSRPDKYFGKRIRMTGYVKAQDVAGWAGLFFRVDEANTDIPLSFDNMEDRKITGTSDWTKYEIVLDVPPNAYNLAFGGLLFGTGQIWFDNISIEIVPTTVLTTGPINDSRSGDTQMEPFNLNFEQ